MPTIDYYLTTSSPWTYFGHERFIALAERHGATIAWRPMQIQNVFAATGGLPLAQRPPARQHYRMVELKRWREKLALPLNLQPAFFPVNPDLANRTAIALIEMGEDPSAFLSRALRAVWADERNIADEQTIAALLDDAGNDSHAAVAKAHTQEVGEIYDRYTEEAIAGGVFGAPSYVLNGESFWGQDRLDLLAEALESGREPFLP